MSAAVLDIDLFRIPPIIDGLNKYEQAFVLIRANRKPVGQMWLPVDDGKLARSTIFEQIKDEWDIHTRQQIVVEDYLQVGIDKPDELPTATVVVTTHNRPRDLLQCLEALLALPDDGQEYLVIDNHPHTNEAKALLTQYADRIRYIREDIPGLSAARNRALREAQNDIVVFTDDDAFPDPGWLRALLSTFDEPTVACATGLVLPFELETEAQCWFERHSPHSRGFIRTVFDGQHHDPLAVSAVGVGASFALRKSILQYIGEFEEALSAGTPARGGEDYELFSRILRSGYRIVYEPEAISWHRHRKTWNELQQVINGYGIAAYAQWTHMLFIEHEWTIPRLPLVWFFFQQLPELVRSILHRPNSMPRDLIVAQLAGCVSGPFAYFRSRKQLRKYKEVAP